MDCDAKNFFTSFFAELECRGLPYVILHSYQNFPDRTDSDVDYAVLDADIPKVHAALSETASRTGWLVAQTLQYNIASYYSVVVNPSKPGMFLKLDRCSHYTRNGCLFIRDEVLLADRKKFNGFYIPSASSEFIYTLAKVFAKDKAITGYLPRLRELSAAEPERSEELFQQVFGPQAGNIQDWFNRPPTDWEQLSAPMHDRNRYRAPQRQLEWRRRLRRFLNPTGLRVAVLGDDNEALERIISRIEALVEPCFRRQSRLGISGGFFEQWKSYLFRELPAYRRSTFIVAAGPPANISRYPRPDLVFQLNAGTGVAVPRFISLDARDVESAAAIAWREIAVFLSRRDARRWNFLVS